MLYSMCVHETGYLILCGIVVSISIDQKVTAVIVVKSIRCNTYKTTCFARCWLGDQVDTKRAISQYIKVVDISGYIVCVCTSIILLTCSFCIHTWNRGMYRNAIDRRRFDGSSHPLHYLFFHYS